MHPALSRIEHRPWSLPKGRWTWRQSWCDLLFAHWPIKAAALRPLVPAGLNLEEFDGTAWIGVVPFRMEGVMRRPLPDLPGISAFAELNVRLYVECDGKPGVWFLSLDAANGLAVWAARRFFYLPYFKAKMDCAVAGEEIDFVSRRVGGGVGFAAVYGPQGAVYNARPGSLEHWLTERYCLYAQARSGALFRAEVQHWPWPLQAAKARIDRNQMLEPHGLAVAGAPLLHFARRLDVVVWPLEPVVRQDQ